MKTDTPRRLCFGEFELDSRAGKLYRGGHPVKIQPQPLRVLTILAERPGEIVSREELHSRVWGSSTFVEFDQGLNYCVRQIRLALSDQAAKPQYLETLPKQGYRFIATVNGSHEEPVDPAPVLEAAQPRRRLLLASSALALCVIAALAIWWIARQNLTTGWQLVRQTKLTFFPGDERDPAFSPDGRSIAFSWTGEQGNNRDIYLMPIGSSHTPNRLTRDAAVDMAPAWSPDGSQIAFLRMIAISRGNLVVVPAGGGPERVIHEVRLKDDFYRSMRPLLTWTPDGTGIAYTAQGDESEKANIYLTDLQGRARKLFEADEASLGATGPAFSRDGKSLAYILVYGPPSFTRVVVRSLTPGYKASERQVLGPSGKDVSSPVWTADAGRLIFAQRSGIFAWEPGTNARQIYNGAALDGMSAAWGPRGSLRIVTSEMARTELRTVPLHPGGLAAAGDAVPFAPASATYQSGPQYSPDGKYVVFHGDRSGAFDIWLARVDGTNTQRLTHLNSLDTGFPRWSPDSKRVAFHSFAASKPQIFLVDVEQALAGAEHATRQVTAAVFGFYSPTWSNDQKYLYADRTTGGARIFRIPTSGGPLEDMFEGVTSRVTPDGHAIIYAKLGLPGIFKRSLDGDPATNPEEKLVDDYKPPGADLNPVSDGIYYIGWNGPGEPRTIRFYGYMQRRSVDVFALPGTPNTPPSLGVSPDRRRMIFSQLAGSGSDLTMIEFR